MQTIIADEHQRVRLPNAKPGQVFEYEADPTGRTITLHEVKKSDPVGEILGWDDLDPRTLCPKVPGEVVRESILCAIREDRENQC